MYQLDTVSNALSFNADFFSIKSIYQSNGSSLAGRTDTNKTYEPTFE